MEGPAPRSRDGAAGDGGIVADDIGKALTGDQLKPGRLDSRIKNPLERWKRHQNYGVYDSIMRFLLTYEKSLYRLYTQFLGETKFVFQIDVTLLGHLNGNNDRVFHPRTVSGNVGNIGFWQSGDVYPNLWHFSEIRNMRGVFHGILLGNSRKPIYS